MGVLLAIESATPAENVAIMRSIVEILKRVNPMGEAEHIEKETGSKGVKNTGPLKPLAKWTKSQSHVHRRRAQIMNTEEMKNGFRVYIAWCKHAAGWENTTYA